MSESDPIIGKKLGDYVIVDILGQGGMARVYRGLDKKLNRYAAVKVIDAHLIREDEAEYRQRFQNEARAIARLNHPGIVGIYQFDQMGTLYYMAMSFIEGKDLRTILKNHAHNGTRMSYREIMDVIYDIGGALDYAHSEGVIHRDVKPSNIMITSNNRRSILTDFGLALSTREGTIGNTFGSAHYIAPEQAVSSAQAVPQSDIYSLGVVLFEMLTNRVPFNDPSAMVVAMKHLNDPPPPPSRVNPNIPPTVDQIVLRALDKEPKKRYPTGMAMAEALEAAFASYDGEIIESDSQIKPLPSWGDTSSSLSRPSRPTAGSNSRRPGSTGMRKELPALPSWDQDRTATPRRRLLNDGTTVTDSRASAITRAQLIKDVPQRSTKRLMLIGGIALIGIIALFAVIVIGTNNNGSGASATPTVEQTEAVAALPSANPDATLTSSNAPSATSSFSESASDDATATAGPIETTAAILFATNTPDSSITADTATPNSTAASTQTAPVEPTSTGSGSVDPNAPILLSYDGDSLVLLNRSTTTEDISNLTFIQIGADGKPLDFDSTRWDQGNGSISSLPEGDCFQVMRDDLPTLGKPTNCSSRQAWSRVSFPHWFWISKDPGATFEIKRGDQVLATCSIASGECAFDPSSAA